MKTIIPQVKDTLGWINGRFDNVEKRISELKDVTLETIQIKQKKIKNRKHH